MTVNMFANFPRKAEAARIVPGCVDIFIGSAYQRLPEADARAYLDQIAALLGATVTWPSAEVDNDA